MLKPSLVILFFLSITSHSIASEFIKPLYKAQAQEFIGYSNLFIDSRTYELRNNDQNTDTKYDIYTTRLQQNAFYGVSKFLTLTADLKYTIDQVNEAGSSETNSSGLEAIFLGASFRVNEKKADIPFPWEVGFKFKPSFANGQDATVNDDGSANNGGYELQINSRIGFLADAFFDFRLHHFFEQTKENATTGDTQSTVDSFTNMQFLLGKQFEFPKKIILNAATFLNFNGENRESFESGGSTRTDSFSEFGIELQGFYSHYKDIYFNVGLEYSIALKDYDVNASDDQTLNDDAFLGFNFGAAYAF